MKGLSKLLLYAKDLKSPLASRNSNAYLKSPKSLTPIPHRSPRRPSYSEQFLKIRSVFSPVTKTNVLQPENDRSGLEMKTIDKVKGNKLLRGLKKFTWALKSSKRTTHTITQDCKSATEEVFKVIITSPDDSLLTDDINDFEKRSSEQICPKCKAGTCQTEDIEKAGNFSAEKTNTADKSETCQTEVIEKVENSSASKTNTTVNSAQSASTGFFGTISNFFVSTYTAVVYGSASNQTEAPPNTKSAVELVKATSSIQTVEMEAKIPQTTQDQLVTEKFNSTKNSNTQSLSESGSNTASAIAVNTTDLNVDIKSTSNVQTVEVEKETKTAQTTQTQLIPEEKTSNIPTVEMEKKIKIAQTAQNQLIPEEKNSNVPTEEKEKKTKTPQTTQDQLVPEESSSNKNSNTQSLNESSQAEAASNTESAVTVNTTVLNVDIKSMSNVQTVEMEKKTKTLQTGLNQLNPEEQNSNNLNVSSSQRSTIDSNLPESDYDIQKEWDERRRAVLQNHFSKTKDIIKIKQKSNIQTEEKGNESRNPQTAQNQLVPKIKNSNKLDVCSSQRSTFNSPLTTKKKCHSADSATKEENWRLMTQRRDQLFNEIKRGKELKKLVPEKLSSDKISNNQSLNKSSQICESAVAVNTTVLNVDIKSTSNAQTVEMEKDTKTPQTQKNQFFPEDKNANVQTEEKEKKPKIPQTTQDQLVPEESSSNKNCKTKSLNKLSQAEELLNTGSAAAVNTTVLNFDIKPMSNAQTVEMEMEAKTAQTAQNELIPKENDDNTQTEEMKQKTPQTQKNQLIPEDKNSNVQTKEKKTKIPQTTQYHTVPEVENSNNLDVSSSQRSSIDSNLTPKQKCHNPDYASLEEWEDWRRTVLLIKRNLKKPQNKNQTNNTNSTNKDQLHSLQETPSVIALPYHRK